MAPQTLGQSAGSLVYVKFVVSANVNGNTGYNPTGDVLKFAFLDQATHAANTIPLNTDLVNGTWETDTVSSQTVYVAKCLVGPGGTFVPTAGTNYWVWLKITDSPEIPLLQVGSLQVS